MDPSLLNLSSLPARAGAGRATASPASGAPPEGEAGGGATFASLLSSSMTSAAVAQPAGLPTEAGEGGAAALGRLSLSALLRLRLNAAAARDTVSARAVPGEAGVEALPGDRLASLQVSSGTSTDIEAPGEARTEEKSVSDDADMPWLTDHALLPRDLDLPAPMVPDPAAPPTPGLVPVPLPAPMPGAVASPVPMPGDAATSARQGADDIVSAQRRTGASPIATETQEARGEGWARPVQPHEASLSSGRVTERGPTDTTRVTEAIRSAAAASPTLAEARPAVAVLGEDSFSSLSGRRAQAAVERESGRARASDDLSSAAAQAADRAAQASLRLQAAAQISPQRAGVELPATVMTEVGPVRAAAPADPALQAARAALGGGAGVTSDTRLVGLTERGDRTGSAEPAVSTEAWAEALAQAQAAASVQAGGAATPVAAAESRVETPFGHPDFADEVVAHVAQHASLSRHGLREVTLHLNPVEMGPVSVRIAIEGSVASVDFAATQAATRQQLEQSLPALAAALGEDGLSLGSSSVGETAPVASSGASSDSLASGSGGSGSSGAFQEGRARDAGGQQASSRQDSGFVVDLPEGRARPSDSAEPAPVRRPPTRAGGLDLFA